MFCRYRKINILKHISIDYKKYLIVYIERNFMKKKNDEEKLNIAMIGHKRIPSREGGVEVVVEELSTRIIKMGHNVTCLNRRGHHVSGKSFNNSDIKEYKGVRIKNVWAIDKKGLAALTSSFLGSIIAAFSNYDVVHFHAEGPCAVILIPKLFGKKCVATIHGLDHKCPKWKGFAKKYIIFGEKCAAKYADEVIVLSKGVKKYFKDTYGRETILIPNGITRPKIIPAKEICNIYGLKNSEYILYLGRLVEGKGIEYLIEAFSRVKTNKKLVIAGGASDSDKFVNELKRLAKKDERIIFTGFVQGEILNELYSNAYVYTLPSDSEGMPLSLLEAMSYGNCCLVSNIPECIDVIEDKGVIFEQKNIDDLYKKLQILCDSREIVDQYRKVASDYICKKYDWDDIVERTLECYIKK